MLELWRMWSTPSLPSLPGPLWSQEVAPDRVLSMGQIELNCHRLFDQDGHQDSSSASLYSKPCTLWLLVIPLAQRLSLWDNWGDERGCDEGHWHAHGRGLPWGVPEVVGTVQQVHSSRRRLLWRGLEFHLCTINKSANMKKVWKLIVCPLYVHFCFFFFHDSRIV